METRRQLQHEIRDYMRSYEYEPEPDRLQRNLSLTRTTTVEEALEKVKQAAGVTYEDVAAVALALAEAAQQKEQRCLARWLNRYGDQPVDYDRDGQ